MICQLCENDLKVFANLRHDLISKQKSLYALAGVENENFNSCEEVEFTHQQENTSDFEMNFEAVDDDEDYIEEEQYIGEDHEEMDAAETIIKIEKVEDKSRPNEVKIEIQQDESTSFDFFEEVVGSVDSDDDHSQYYENESMRDDNTM